MGAVCPAASLRSPWSSTINITVRLRTTSGSVASAHMHAGNPSAYVGCAPLQRPCVAVCCLLSRTSTASADLACKHEQVLNACGEAVTVLTFDSITDVLMGVSHSAGCDGSQMGGNELQDFETPIRQLCRLH